MNKLWLIAALLAAGTNAHATDAGVQVVEMFTSKYCPNCPSAEHKLKEEAVKNPDLLVLFEHVDYWDHGDDKDPYGLADITQRQYDYSNTVGSRPGQVFTPMPIFNGQIMISPPLWLSWSGALDKARAGAKVQQLTVKRLGDGGLSVKVPAGLEKRQAELWVLGVEPVDGGPVRRVRSIEHVDAGRADVHVPKALAPSTPEVVVLLQETGPKAVLAVGQVR